MIKRGVKNKLLACGVMAFCSFRETASAQDYEAMFQKHKNEQAIVTHNDEHLVIKAEGGELVAFSNVSKEKMMIGDLASGIYNSEFLFDSYFHKLQDHDEQALIRADLLVLGDQ